MKEKNDTICPPHNFAMIPKTVKESSEQVGADYIIFCTYCGSTKVIALAYREK